MLAEICLQARLQEAKRCARVLELDISQRNIQAYVIACVTDTDIHIDQIGEVLGQALAHPSRVLLGAFEKSEIYQSVLPLLNDPPL
ncbi:hypothetical protein ACUYOF_23105 [Photobacterium ganghwense]|uniref:hypothetical protein n=1 Tax=Photobacterium ganghwense TaxID=320778 RepID=UPI004055A9DF